MSQDKPSVIDQELIVRIQNAGREVVDKIQQAAILPNHQNGYLSISTEWGRPISRTFLGRQMTQHEVKSWDGGHDSRRTLYEKMIRENGRTSSDVNNKYPGAVYHDGLIIDYFDCDGRFDRLTNEAIAIMTAVRAGLLTLDEIWHRHANPLTPPYNDRLCTLLTIFGYKSDYQEV